jgi:hypothetical protein
LYVQKSYRIRKTRISDIKEVHAKVEQGRIATELAAAVARAKEADARIAEAQRGSAEANARATKAQESLALAEQHSAEAKTKAEGFRLDISKANERAANAELGAAQARLELVTMQVRLSDRTLNTSQQSTLISRLSPFTGSVVDVIVWGDTPKFRLSAV